METRTPNRRPSTSMSNRGKIPNPGYDKLEKLYSTLQSKHERVVSDLNALKIRYDKQESDLNRTKMTLESIVEQKHDLNHVLSESKQYIRKLESKLTLGKNSRDLSHTNQLAVLNQNNQELSLSNAGLAEENKKLREHIEVLGKALRLKTEEFGSDLRSSLLYDVGASRREVEKLQNGKQEYREVALELQNKLDEALMQIEELKLIRESNNDELSNLETHVLHLKSEKENMNRTIQDLTKERLNLLEMVNELNTQPVPLPRETDDRQIRKFKKETQDLAKENKALIENEIILREELDKTQNSLQKFKDIIHLKDEDLQVMNEEKKKLEKNVEDLEELVQRYEDKLLKTEQGQTLSEQMLKENMEKALLDLQQLADERDSLKDAMNEAINKCANSLIVQQNLEKEKEKLQKQTENLVNSKGLLQQTMADQINSLKIQLEDFRQDLVQCESENARLLNENRELRQILTENRPKHY